MKRAQYHIAIKALALTGILIAALSTSYLFAAWTEAPVDPTAGNTPPPLTVAPVNQEKAGGLSVPFFIVYDRLQIQNGTQAAGRVLVSDTAGQATWRDVSSVGSGGISQLERENGINLSPNPIIDTGTISADTSYLQRRVTGSCPAGQGITSVGSDGSVNCEPVGASAGVTCSEGGVQYSPGASCEVGYSPYSCLSGQGARKLNKTCRDDGTWSTYHTQCGVSTDYPTC